MDHSPGAAGSSKLQLTGERTLPGIWHETYWFERHVVAYRLAADLVRQQDPPATVLDAGCGEGYGLAILAAGGAQRVVGADLDPEVAAHARQRYAVADPRVEVVTAELRELPLADGEVDLTVSFQVIEHLHDVPGYLASLSRVTRPGGRVVIATPNRLTFTPDSDVPVNPFHTREFTAAELAAELTRAGLDVVSIVGVHHGPRLRAVELAARRPLPDLLAARPPEAWPRVLAAVVRRVDASWFRVREDDLDASLDLVAICRTPQP